MMKRCSKRVVLVLSFIFSLGLCISGEVVCAQSFSGTVSPETVEGVAESEDLGGLAGDEINLPLMEELPSVSTLNALRGEDGVDSEIYFVDHPQMPDAVDLSQYTLGKNDVIEVKVLRHSEVSGKFSINAEGKIQYEFLGDVLVEGLKKDEVKTKLVKLLSTFIISPEITVKIVGYNSKVVYVVGEVGRPGKVFMRGDTITVREALIQAGLPLLSAKTTKVTLITPSDSGQIARTRINVHKLLYKGDLRENKVMKPGDTLYVPPTFMARTLRVMKPIAAPIGTASTTGREVMTGF